MKLVTFSYRGKNRIGVVNSDMQIVDLTFAVAPDVEVPATMTDFIKLGRKGLNIAAQALSSGNKAAVIPVEDITYLLPVLSAIYSL